MLKPSDLAELESTLGMRMNSIDLSRNTSSLNLSRKEKHDNSDLACVEKNQKEIIVADGTLEYVAVNEKGKPRKFKPNLKVSIKRMNIHFYLYLCNKDARHFHLVLL